MKSKKYFHEIIDAYIIPTTDPHRVLSFNFVFLLFIFYFNRMNMLLIDINEENLFQILQDQMVQR